MATRISYRQITIDPSTDDKDNSIVIPHVDGGWCQVPQIDFAGGGNPEAGRFLINVVIFEPVPDV